MSLEMTLRNPSITPGISFYSLRGTGRAQRSLPTNSGNKLDSVAENSWVLHSAVPPSLLSSPLSLIPSCCPHSCQGQTGYPKLINTCTTQQLAHQDKIGISQSKMHLLCEPWKKNRIKLTMCAQGLAQMCHSLGQEYGGMRFGESQI